MAEADPFATANDTLSVVVAGNMNPAIHHPAWYKLIHASTEEELASSGMTPLGRPDSKEGSAPKEKVALRILTTATPICTPALSQFTVGKMKVTCTEQNWSISSYEPQMLPRLVEIASKVFEALAHTPVSAYGMNFSFHRKVSMGNVGLRLAEMVDSTPISLFKNRQGMRSAKIGYSVSQPERTLNASIEASVKGADVVFVGINAHHPIRPSGTGFEQFELAPLLRASRDADLRDARDILSAVLSALGKKGND